MIGVVYEVATGRIVECRKTREEPELADGLAWKEVDEFRPDWDTTHHVGANGQLYVIPAAIREARELEQAWVRFRARRDAKLRDEVDGMNPIRWAAMSDAKKAEWVAYRQALLDLPQTTQDPRSFEWPVAPT